VSDQGRTTGRARAISRRQFCVGSATTRPTARSGELGVIIHVVELPDPGQHPLRAQQLAVIAKLLRRAAIEAGL
jgi:hypothetical protein